jgi:hypothetical protein
MRAAHRCWKSSGNLFKYKTGREHTPFVFILRSHRSRRHRTQFEIMETFYAEKSQRATIASGAGQSQFLRDSLSQRTHCASERALPCSPLFVRSLMSVRQGSINFHLCGPNAQVRFLYTVSNNVIHGERKKSTWECAPHRRRPAEQIQSRLCAGAIKEHWPQNNKSIVDWPHAHLSRPFNKTAHFQLLESISPIRNIALAAASVRITSSGAVCAKSESADSCFGNYACWKGWVCGKLDRLILFLIACSQSRPAGAAVCLRRIIYKDNLQLNPP